MSQLHINPSDGHPSNHQKMMRARKTSQLRKFQRAKRKPGHVKRAKEKNLMMEMQEK